MFNARDPERGKLTKVLRSLTSRKASCNLSFPGLAVLETFFFLIYSLGAGLRMLLFLLPRPPSVKMRPIQ